MILIGFFISFFPELCIIINDAKKILTTKNQEIQYNTIQYSAIQYNTAVSYNLKSTRVFCLLCFKTNFENFKNSNKHFFNKSATENY